MNIRIGQGIDFHRLEKGLKLWLGGVNIPSEKGCVAHSDGDVLLHAICDAILGAGGLKDIGHQFPDTNPEFKNIDSKFLLKKTYDLVKEKGFGIVNIDCTISAQQPKLNPYIPEMEKMMATVLEIDEDRISVKATTTEKLGFEGREEGISVNAVVLLEKK